MIKAISDRGNDIVLVCQYNDCVIFDCVTSTKQRPIKVPLLQNDSPMFAKLDVSNGGSMIKVKMLMDSLQMEMANIGVVYGR